MMTPKLYSSIPPTGTSGRVVMRQHSLSRLVIAMLLFGLSVAAAGAQPSGLRIVSSSNRTQSISQYGITWYFDTEVEFGKFVNGDYWVIGPVTITDIDPPWQEGRWGYRHGTMLNATGGNQGLDAYLDPTYGTIRYDSSLNIEVNPGFPITIEGDNSVISAIGVPEESTQKRLRPMLKTVAVLTVLSETPFGDAFRPPYVGTEKTQYRWSNVDITLLPSFAPVADTPSIDGYINRLRRPWFVTASGWQGRYMHPQDNMPGNYHRDIGRFLSQASVLLMMDVPDREELLKHYIQVGIDYYATGQNMEGTSAQWQWPVIFAGIMLGNNHMRDVYLTGDRHPSNQARAMWQLYRLPHENRSAVVSQIVPGGDEMVTWTNNTAAWRQDISPADEYHQEHLHPSEWNDAPGSLWTRETYRRINSPAYVGFAAAAAVMGAQDRFYRAVLFFDYAERWKEEDLSDPSHDVFSDQGYTIDASEYGSSTSRFVDNFWQLYYPKE